MKKQVIIQKDSLSGLWKMIFFKTSNSQLSDCITIQFSKEEFEKLKDLGYIVKDVNNGLQYVLSLESNDIPISVPKNTTSRVPSIEIIRNEEENYSKGLER